MLTYVKFKIMSNHVKMFGCSLTPSVLVTEGFDDFVTVGYLFTDTRHHSAASMPRSRLSIEEYSQGQNLLKNEV